MGRRFPQVFEVLIGTRKPLGFSNLLAPGAGFRQKYVDEVIPVGWLVHVVEKIGYFLGWLRVAHEPDTIRPE